MPDWNNCWVLEQDGEAKVLMGVELRLVAEPLYVKKGCNGAALVAMGWLDGKMSTLAQLNRLPGYECFVLDEHPEFQEFIKKNLPMGNGREKPGLTFFRRF